PRIIDDYSILPSSNIKKEIFANDYFGNIENKYIKEIDAFKFGILANKLGAGRTKKEDKIDHGAGIELFIKVGDLISSNSKILALYSNRENIIEEVARELKDAISIDNEKVEEKSIIIKTI
ncbi:MAG: hypothetical protein ACK4YF_09670, partial [Exilispira sp.]